LIFLYFLLARRVPAAAPAAAAPLPSAVAVPYDPWQAKKALAVTIAALVLFVTPLPAALTALAVAGLLLTSRRLHTRTILGLVDWHLLAFFCGLFVVNRGLEVSGWTAAAKQALGGAGIDLAAPAVLIPAVALLGILVGNVPAVMMLLPLLPREAEIGYMVALVSTFAGNAVLFGSIANLIVADQASRLGVRIGLLDHLKVGLPVTIVSLAAAGAAVMLLW